MNRTIFSSAAIGILFVVAINLLAEEQAAAPIYQDGDFWHFSLGPRIYEAAIKDGKVKVFDAKPDQRIEVEAGIAQRLKVMLAVEQDRKEFLQFPLSVGKVWNSSYQEDTPGPYRMPSISARSSVTGIEEMTVAAGTFRVFKIERVETFPRRLARSNKAPPVTRTYTYYYSPQAKSVVKYRFENRKRTTEIDLIKFGSARPN